MLRQILFLIVLFFSFTGTAQLPEQLYFKHLTPQDGLTQGTVNDVYTDTRGFVWMTGLDGINRFDGLKCLANEEIAPGLGDVGRTNGIKEDQQGNIWFGYVYGIIRYSYATNRFEKIVLPEPDSKIEARQSYTYHIRDIDTDGNILIWLYAKTGLVYNTRSAIPHLIQMPGDKNNPTSDFITIVDPLTKKHTWNCLVGDKDSASIYQLKTKENEAQWVKKKVFLLKEFVGSSMLMPDDNTLIFLSNSRVCKFNLQTGKMMYSDQLPPNPVSSILLLDSKNRLWLSNNGNGIILFDAGTLAIVRKFTNDENNPASIASNTARVFTDHFDMMWVTSAGSGVDYCSLQEQRFRSYLSGTESRNGKFSNFIRGLAEGADGNFYCSTPSGVFVLNNALRFKHFLPGVNNRIPSPDLLLSGQYLYYASDEYKNNGLYRYDLKTNKQTWFLNTHKQFSGNKNLVYQISKLVGNALLIASMDGLWKFETDKEQFVLLPGITIANEQVVFSYQDKRQQIYKGVNLLGLMVYQFDGNSWKEVFRLNKKITIKHCAEINDSLIGIGTSEGLYLFNTARLKIEKHYTTDNGLANNVVYAIMPDAAKNLWLSTNKGLSYLNVLKNEFTHFTMEDGLQANEFNTHVALKATDGRIIFGGVNGLTVVEPDVMAYKMRPPILQVTALKTDSILNPYQYGQGNSTLILPAGTQTFEMELTAINFSNPALCKIKYRLSGYDNDWRIISNHGKIWYVRLPPGKYVLEAMASNIRGEFTGQIKQIEVVVKAFWWQTSWFKIVALLCFILFIILSVMAYLQYRLKRQKEKLEKQFAVQSERERITADLHDDVGATLSSMNIYGELANAVWDTQPQRSKEMVGKIADQSKELMWRMSDIVWSLRSPGVEKNSLAARLKNYTYDLLTAKNIIAEFDIDESVSVKMVNPLVRKNILLIAKEAINNIAKYSQATKAFISFKREGDEVLLSIGDNGKGFDQSVTVRGDGLENINQRCRQLNGICTFDSTPGKGVVLVCRFPLAIISHTG